MVRIRTRTRYNLGPKGTIILFSLFGILFLIIGISMLSKTVKMANRGISVAAQVSNVKVSKSSNSTSYTPEVTFKTLAGDTVSVTLNKSTNRPAHSVGDKVNIIYLEDDPKTIIVDSFFDKYGFPIIFIVAGIICLFIGVGRILSPKH
ncbi:MAG TPA: DUF3592 domain-containing protein [Clostridia bacterium]